MVNGRIFLIFLAMYNECNVSTDPPYSLLFQTDAADAISVLMHEQYPQHVMRQLSNLLVTRSTRYSLSVSAHRSP